MARSIVQWLDAYSESHQHRINKTLHWVCVPVITWTVIALLWSISIGGNEWLNLGVVFIFGALVFYSRLSIFLMAGMVVFACFCVLLIQWHQAISDVPLWKTSIFLFVLAWIGQFIGHKVEGKKPSFFEDIQFLLIGPVWLLSFLYKKAGLPI